MLAVLIVDSDVSMLATLAEMVKACGHVPCYSSNFRDSFEVLNAIAFDVLIISIDKNDITGVSFAVAAKARQPDIWTIGLGMSLEDASPFAKASIDAFLAKPFSIDQLSQCILSCNAPGSSSIDKTQKHSYVDEIQ